MTKRKTTIEPNREHWLTSAADHLMSDLFGGRDRPSVRISCGWPVSRGASEKRRVLGECWNHETSADGHREIFISPMETDPVDVLAIIAHELCHAYLESGVGHKGAFKQLATLIGLEGKMTATVPGEELRDRLVTLAADLGPYPHSKVTPSRKSVQTTRMMKAECHGGEGLADLDPECGYTVRLTRKWIDEVGYPICPLHGTMTGDYTPGEDED